MRRPFQPTDVEPLTALWNRTYPERYRIDPDIFRINTIECAVFEADLSLVEEASGEATAMVLVKRSAARDYGLGPLDQAHLSAIAFDDPRVAAELVRAAASSLRARGVRCLVFGQDSRHFWPGCPLDTALPALLEAEGFKPFGDDVADFERELSDYAPPDATKAGAEYRVLLEADRPALIDFMRSEFPGRWEHDVRAKTSAEGPGCVLGAFAGGAMRGFCLIQESSCRLPLSGAVWRSSLGPRWGALGPIGVARHSRNRGLGDGLLASGLMELRGRGVERCIIDWTTLEGFYGRHGFVATRRYRPMRLAL